MAARPSFPTDYQPRIDVRAAYSRFDDFATVVGSQKAGAGGCWCMAYRDSRVSNAERPAYMRNECETTPGPGVLLYVDDVVAGWCSIAPRADYRRLMGSRTIPIIDDADAWVAVCFVVRAGYRKHGLMHPLLAGAVDHAREQGAEVVEGYPAAPGWTSSPGTSGRSRCSRRPGSSGRHRPRDAAAAVPAGSCASDSADPPPATGPLSPRPSPESGPERQRHAGCICHPRPLSGESAGGCVRSRRTGKKCDPNSIESMTLNLRHPDLEAST